MRLISLIFVSLCLFGCAKKTQQSSSHVKTLDTSFLKLGKVGTSTADSSIELNSHIHVLTIDQRVNILGDEGEIEISNFDYSLLEDGDVIIGNESDKYLFKFLSKDNEHHTNTSSIIVAPGTISDITRDTKATIKLDITPNLQLEASESRSLKNTTPPPANNSNLNSASDGKKSINPMRLNVLNFENYEVINTNSQAQLLGNGLKSGNKTQFNLQAGNEFKVTINKGFLELIPTFRGEFNFTNLNKYNLNSTFDSLVRYEFEITVETKGRTVGEVSFPLFKEVSIPVRVPGPVPVYIDIDLEFPAGVKIGTTNGGKLTYLVKSEYALTAQTYFDSVTGKQITSHYDYIINNREIKQIENQNGYLFELFFEPRMKTKFYRVLGPYAYINSNIQANIQIPLRANEKDIFVNFSGGVGVTLDEPIFGTTIADIQTPSLFNLSTGWDVIGPNSKKKETIKINLQKDINLQVNNLAKKNRITLNLRPDNLSLLGKVKIYKRPSFGKLVLSSNFSNSGLAYYYPPKIVEGKDSFQIQIVEKGVKSKPSRIIINLSESAKQQARQQKRTLADYKNQSLNLDATDVIGLPSGVYSFSEAYPGSNNGIGKDECKPNKDNFCSNRPQPKSKKETLIKNKSFSLATIKLYPKNICSNDIYEFYPKLKFNKYGFFTIEVTAQRSEEKHRKEDLEQIASLIGKSLTSYIYKIGEYSSSYHLSTSDLSRQLENTLKLLSNERIKYSFNFTPYEQRPYSLWKQERELEEIKNRFHIINEVINLPYQNPQKGYYESIEEMEYEISHDSMRSHLNIRPADLEFVKQVQESFNLLKADEETLQIKQSYKEDC